MRSATAKMSCRLCEMSTTARPCSARRLHELEHLLGLGDAERGGRLVEDHEAAVPHHGAADRDRLALAAREARDLLADRADGRHAKALQDVSAVRASIAGSRSRKRKSCTSRPRYMFWTTSRLSQSARSW